MKVREHLHEGPNIYLYGSTSVMSSSHFGRTAIWAAAQVAAQTEEVWSWAGGAVAGLCLLFVLGSIFFVQGLRGGLASTYNCCVV